MTRRYNQPMNSTEQFEAKLQRFVVDQKMIEPGQHILVALSGGMDSAVLLHALKYVSKQEKFTLSALHINHMLRGRAAIEDEEKARKMCEALCVPFYCLRFDVAAFAKKNKLSIELSGRAVRYEQLFALKKIIDADKIATAHHFQDNIETVIMRCMRGVGVEGLRGIAPYRRGGVIRPLISFTKTEIVQYARMRKIKYGVDATNAQNEYLRNRVRNVVIPRCKEVNPDFEQLIERLRRCAVDISMQIAEDIKEAKAKIQSTEGMVILPVAIVQNTKSHLRPYLIRATFKQAGMLTDIEEKHVRKILRMPLTKTTWMLNMPGKVCFKREYENFLIKKTKQKDEEKQEFCIAVKKNGNTCIEELGIDISVQSVEKFEKNNHSLYEKYIDCDKIYGNLCLRNKRALDRFYPLGMSGSKSLKKYFIDKKIPKVKRESVLLLCDEKEIIWVLGHGISENFKVDAQTKNVLKIAIKQRKQELGCTRISKESY